MFKRALIIAMFAMLGAAVLVPALLPPGLTQAQGAVMVTPNRDYINVRLWPALGATVIGDLGPDDTMTATGFSLDGEWVRIDFHGDEGWVAAIVVNANGALTGLPLADPRTIPYNSNEAPSAGVGSPEGLLYAQLDYSGVRLRSGPSTAYPIIQNLPRYAEVAVTGRVASNRWVQVRWQDVLGWLFVEDVVLYSPGDGVTIEAVPLIPPASDTGVRLSHSNAREKFLIVDDIRRDLESARAALDIIDLSWQNQRAETLPEVCAAPPVMEAYWLGSVERNNYPELVEVVARLNQGHDDLNNALEWYLAVCNDPDNPPGIAIAGGPAAVERARVAFDEVAFQLNRSYTVQVQGIHAHVNYAQDQFERIEAIWLEFRLGIVDEPPCINQPEPPPDYALTAWEQENYPELIPVVVRLNEGLIVLRDSINLWRNVCYNYNNVGGYFMPPEVGADGYNKMLLARQILNDVRDHHLIAAYSDPRYLVPAPTGTPDPTISAILHAPYTPTFTPSPTPSFQYAVSAIVARSEFHPACNWFGVAGQVLDAAGNARPAALIHVWGPGVDRHLLSGSDLAYGAAGFEVALRADAAQYNTWYAQIEDGFGNPLSPRQEIVFEDGCELNVAQVIFTQH